MCQLGAVLVSTRRIFRRDGVRSHHELHELARKEHPRERFREAEYDFIERRWGYGGTEAEVLKPLGAKRACLLRIFAGEHWNDADALMRFCEQAGLPENLLLTAKAAKTYDAACAKAWKTYDAACAKARKPYYAACYFAWFHEFSEPTNRIQAWR